MELRRTDAQLRPTAACIALLSALAGCDTRETKTVAPLDVDPGVLQAWEQIATVLQHPRCLNCHQVDAPLQGDGRPHSPRVERGPDNLGAAAMRCSNCHNESGNNPSSGVPGAPHWSLAPESMSWAGLSSGEPCHALKDPELNGSRSAKDLEKHMGEDKLVLWGWEPGGNREPVPIAHDEFMQLFKTWTAAGMPCPDE